MIREYKCKNCGEKCEYIEKYEDDLKKDCPKCKSLDSLEYIPISLSSFSLKGTGWFKSGGY